MAHGLDLAAAGADYVDVGGESTRPAPGAWPPTRNSAVSCPWSRSSPGPASRSASTPPGHRWRPRPRGGAGMVNDVSGGLADPAMAPSSPMPVSRGCSCTGGGTAATCTPKPRMTTSSPRCGGSSAPRRRGAGRGRGAEQIVVDPGLGFAKQPEHDLALLAGLDRITDLGFPVLVGASRTRFLGALLATDDGRPRPPVQRDDATLATSVLAARAGAWGVRVHDVAGSVDAVRVVAAVSAGGSHARRSEPDQAPTAPSPANDRRRRTHREVAIRMTTR